MTIIKARVLGYCVGVKRAIDTAKKALEEYSGQRSVYTLGPLIHNPIVLKNLEDKGLKVLSEKEIPQLEPSSVVIIRAHGTTPKVLEDLESREAMVIDCTCPRVHLSQKRAAESCGNGFDLLIAGDRNHGEVISIEGYSNGNVTVIQSTDEAKALELGEKTAIIAQTTFSPKEFDQICTVLKQKAGNEKQLVIYNSICSATMERQTALDELEGKTDGIIVIGGRNSANTRRLYEKALKIAPKAVLIEKEDEIPEDFYALGTVGLTAGASTPDIIIEKVEKSLQEQSLKIQKK